MSLQYKLPGVGINTHPTVKSYNNKVYQTEIAVLLSLNLNTEGVQALELSNTGFYDDI